MSDNAADHPVTLTIIGRKLEPKPMPAAFLRARAGTSSARAPGAATTAPEPDDDLLPAGMEIVEAVDVSPAARDTEANRITWKIDPGHILVLELADGGTLVANPGRLKEALDRAGASHLQKDSLPDLDKLGPDTSAQRGVAAMLKGIVAKITLLKVPDNVEDSLLNGIDLAQAGVSWLGTKLLMAAIEARLPCCGLFRWNDSNDTSDELTQVTLTGPAGKPPPDAELLIFVHGTGSSTVGSFGHLRTAEPELWQKLRRSYGEHIYGFEHRTLSQSPIENALELVQALPHGAHVSLVSHSRGGLVADLLCLADFGAQIEQYSYPFHSPGTRDAGQREAVLEALKAAYAEQRETLLKLAGELRERKLVIHRYARIASPANGTLLASGNFDVFLSGLLTLLGAVPFLYTSVLYRVFRRAVIEIAKRRTDPHMVPGIEAMLPDSPLAQFLCEAPVKPDIQMAVIAGDVEGGDMLSRLRVALTDFVLFDKEDNDLVVDTPAMLAGIAPRARARVLFERGAHVSHFRYCSNSSSRAALAAWLTDREPLKLERFIEIPGREAYANAMKEAGGHRSPADTQRLPIVVIVPDLMATHLKERQMPIWYPPVPGQRGLELLAPDRPNAEAAEVFDVLYARLCGELAKTHQVFTFPYDWRLPLRRLGERLAGYLERFRNTPEPVRLVAHGMGGLVVRACVHASEQKILEVLMGREGARLVMLGTPNRGTHAVVADLLGKGDGLRSLWRQEFRGAKFRDLLSTFAAFPGLLSLLPTRDFADTFDATYGTGDRNYYSEAYWQKLSDLFSDRWFGEKYGAVPKQELLDGAGWLCAQDAQQERRGEALTLGGAGSRANDPKTIYLYGDAPSTPCGIAEAQAGLLSTTAGDGVVTWESGRLPWIDSYYFMPARHGDLLATQEYFPALVELLKTGTTRLLSHEPPVHPREKSGPVLYDAAPPTAADSEAVQRCLLGGSLRSRVPAGRLRRLAVTVRAMDLRFLSCPIMVGHYEQDPISGPEAQIDRELLGGDLSKRYNLGQYAGARGSATVVLRGTSANERGGRLSGAVVTGLGRYDGSLSASDLTEAVRVGALRFLLQIMDVLGKDERELQLGSLLLGFNSSASLSAAASVDALVRGVLLANARFHERTGLNIRIATLDIVELYLDTAISAVYGLRDQRERLKQFALKHDTELAVCDELMSGEGVRQRLRDTAEASYWPRIIVTDADRGEENARAQPLPAAAGQEDAPIADRLRFMYIGTRARAETTVQQRQPSLIETLVRQQIDNHEWNPEFGRMLFQLMVPHDFKDAARQLDRLVLVVDGYTANLPWELMLADSPPEAGADKEHDQRPLAVRASVVRQLAALRYRPQVMQAMAYTALVIGNPTVRGFRAAFSGGDSASGVNGELPPLFGARDEAWTVAQVLSKHGYEVADLIGDIEQAEAPLALETTARARGHARLGPGPIGAREDRTDATHVLAALYRQPWRILHISGHGVFRMKHRDGRLRSGVVLSDGLLITAAEVAAMEVVPELVFLNCCHSGQFDGGRHSNRLAASIARELIEIGVRCVLVAGWAVDDTLARLFGTSFYEQLLGQRKQFGEAVSAARKAVWDDNRNDLTWGAFQAYGDPGWMAEAGAEDADEPPKDEKFVALEEMLDALTDVRVRLSHRREAFADQDGAMIAKQVEMLATKRCHAKWQARPELHAALGTTRRELNQVKEAYDAFLRAVQLEDRFGKVSIRDIEELADVEAQYGEQCAERALTGENGASLDQERLRRELDRSLALLEQALSRLDALDRLSDIAAAPEGDDHAAPPQPPAAPNCVRQALRGRIHRRTASVHARRLLALPDKRGAEAWEVQDGMEEELRLATAAYKRAEGSPARGDFAPELALSRLALEALGGFLSKPETQAPAITFARLCAHGADIEQPGDAAAALLRAKALLVESLITGSLGDDGPGGQAAFENILQAYADATRGIALKPSELDAIVTDIEALSRLYRALSTRDEGPDDSWARIARTREQITENLRKLARRLQPTRTPAAEGSAGPGHAKQEASGIARGG